MPGQIGHRQPELRGEQLGDPHAVGAQRGERPGRAAELHASARSRSSRSALDLPGHQREPARRLEPERDRQRLLQQRAPGHQRVRGAARPAPAQAAPYRAARRSSRSSPARIWSIGAVSIASWLVAPQWTYAARLGPDRSVSIRTSGIAGVPASAASR